MVAAAGGRSWRDKGKKSPTKEKNKKKEKKEKREKKKKVWAWVVN